MDALLALAVTLLHLLLVVIGFGLVVFIHEMGHFLTARWAGIRVFAFALGFGPAVVSYRKGLGWRRGSSEREYLAMLGADSSGSEGSPGGLSGPAGAISPTEYRLNALPFGGYVKMLGQHDLHPEAGPGGPDSYQAQPIWKRMVVISGGVVMNVVLALALFMLVFFVGLETEPPKVGRAAPESPAARVAPVNAEALGIETPGLHPGDRVERVNGRAPDDFNDIVMAAAMAGPGQAVRLEVERPGVPEMLRFEIVPERNQFTNLLDIGVEPARTLTIPSAYAREPALWRAFAARYGLEGVEPGMRVVAIDGAVAGSGPAESYADLLRAVRASEGRPVGLTFESDGGERVEITLRPEPELMLDDADPDPMGVRPVRHLLGLVPVMTVGGFDAERRGFEQGLREGDVFVRLGEVEFPSVDAGIREVQRHAGRAIPVVVLRRTAGGPPAEVELSPAVGADGRIGFTTGNTASESTLVTLAPSPLRAMRRGAEPFVPAALNAITRPGSRILTVDGRGVATLGEVRAALQRATAEAHAQGQAAAVTLTLELPLPAREDGSRPTESVTMAIESSQLERLHALSWESPVDAFLFEPESFILRATGPIDALRKGFNRTHRMMMMTYLTLGRLFQGTVKVDNLKGPVGIAHLGTQVADRGLIWLLFFMGLISINLAVINFLPLPIADGGQFLMLLYEQLRGKPLPIPVQNAITGIGLLLLVSVFLLVTYNDVARLFGG